jgi:hypothetical protein
MAFNDYSWVIRYFRPGGTGLQDGTSWGDAFSLAGMQADLTPGRLYRGAGDFVPTAGIVTSGTPGTAVNPIGFEAWKADLSGPVDDFTDMCSISGAGHLGPVWIPGNYQMWRGFDVKNGAAKGFDNIACRYSTWTGCWIRNHTTRGMFLSRNNSLSRCRVTGNGEIGVYIGLSSSIDMCEVYDNGASIDNLFVSSGGGVSINKCYLSGGSNAVRILVPDGTSISFCTIDGATTGLNSSGSNGPIKVLANIITNNATGMSSTALNIVDYNCFYGNTLDQSALTKTFSRRGNFFIDPQFKNILADDYEIQNPALIGVPILPMLGTRNIGAWEDVGGGLGGPAGMTTILSPRLGC